MTSATRELIVTPLSDVRTRRQRWAWTDLVPLGVATILAGRGGIGKSTILTWLTAAVTNGTLPGDLRGTPATVGLICGEDDPATTLVPRLRAAGARLDLVRDLSAVHTRADDGSEWSGMPSIADDLAALRKAIRRENIRVLIVDPIISMMSGDANKLTDVRRNLDPIATLAADLDIALILVAHFGKGAGNASDKLSGSHGFRDMARSVLLLAVDEETEQRVLSVDKSNYSPRSPSLAFSIASVQVETDDGEATVVGHARLLGETALTVQTILDRTSDARLADQSAGILSFVNETAESVSPSDVASACDVDNNKASKYLQRLADAGRIKHISRGRYARLTADQTPTTSV